MGGIRKGRQKQIGRRRSKVGIGLETERKARIRSEADENEDELRNAMSHQSQPRHMEHGIIRNKESQGTRKTKLAEMEVKTEEEKEEK